jgi:hypothetical protein
VELDTQRVELATQLVAERLVVGTCEDVVSDVDDRHVLVRDRRP